MRVLLNAGHGEGIAHRRGGLLYNEGDNNFYYSLVLKQELEQYENVIVDLVRNKISDNPSLAERSAMGKGYDLFFSIHSNATDNSTTKGTEVWDSVEKPNKVLAKAICDATAKLFNHNNRGVKYKEGQVGYNWYAELRFNEAKSSMIVENGFHTNYEDCLFFKDNHRLIAEVQARVIAEHYGLKKVNIVEDKSQFSTWAIEAMKWAMDESRQLTDGVDPKEPLTLERMITILYRYNNLKK